MDEALEVELTAKDERDVQKSLDKVRKQLEDDSTLSDNDREVLLVSIEKSIRLAKRLAKKKFTPKKYRKPEWKYPEKH